MSILVIWPSLALEEVKELPDSRVHVVVVDGLGGKLYGGEIKLFLSKRTGRDLASRFHLDKFREQVASAVPVGEYQLRVNQPGFPVASRLVHVLKPDEWVYVCVRTATVHIIDIGPMQDSDGDFKVVRFTDVADGNDYAFDFHHETGTEIPYGIYELVVSKPFANNVNREVYVFKNDVWVVIFLELSRVSAPEYLSPGEVVTGEVINFRPEEEPIYVTLVGVHTPYTIDDRVLVSGGVGTFKLAGVNPDGQLLLITSGKNGILNIRELAIPRDEHVVVNLGDANTRK
jgi:hypothetical protein